VRHGIWKVAHPLCGTPKRRRSASLARVVARCSGGRRVGGAAAGLAGARDGAPPLPVADAPGPPSGAPGGVDRSLGHPPRGGPGPFGGGAAAAAGHPGGQPVGAETVLAEVGPILGQFASAAHRAAGAGMCPGNSASAGQRRRGRIPPGNRCLKRRRVQAAGAASPRPGTSLAAQYRRRAKRRDRKRALVAVGQTLLGSV
jgi:hypothetical protein